jgi:large repetitive protein
MRFVGGDGRPGNTLGVETEGHDVDGDPVEFEIAWQKDGQPSGSGNRLTAPVKRGDKVTVTIIPFDGKERGTPVSLSREILNTPPAIEGQEQFQVSDNDVTFHVRASDADGDPLTYSIKDAPAGMSIDRSTGWVRWVTSPGIPGKVPFTVIVSDGSGGESTARFSVTISEAPDQGVAPR